MSIDFEQIWTGEIHRQFIASLEPGQLSALWRLLLVASFADDDLTVEERRTLASSLASVEGFDATIDLDDTSVTVELEDLYSRFESEPESLLADLGESLGDDRARRHTFRTVVQLMQTDGFVEEEAAFARLLGESLGLEPEIVDFAIRDAHADS